MMNPYTGEKQLVTYKIMVGDNLADLERRVNHFLNQPENYLYALRGELQHIGHYEYVQVLTETK
jgi:hypothetical protein